jgi:hypothetical protein
VHPVDQAADNLSRAEPPRRREAPEKILGSPCDAGGARRAGIEPHGAAASIYRVLARQRLYRAAGARAVVFARAAPTTLLAAGAINRDPRLVHRSATRPASLGQCRQTRFGGSPQVRRRRVASLNRVHGGGLCCSQSATPTSELIASGWSRARVLFGAVIGVRDLRVTRFSDAP